MDQFNFLPMFSEPISSATKDTFLSSAPPRHVPPEIAKKVIPWRDTWLSCLVGAGVIVLGLALSGVIVPRHLASEWRLEKEVVEVVSGEILSSLATKTKVNGTRIWKYQFGYHPTGKSKQRGIAYTSGKRWDRGQAVDVRYLIADFQIAVPVGARLDETPPWLSLILIFPLVGIVSICGTIHKRTWKRRLLSHGMVKKAVVNAVEPSKFQNTGQLYYKLRLRSCESGMLFEKGTRDAAEIDTAEAKLKSGEPLTILYDPHKPKRFFVTDCWSATAATLPTERFLRENLRPIGALPRNSATAVVTDTFLRMPVPRPIPKEILRKAAGGSGTWVMQMVGAGFFAVGLFLSWQALSEDTPMALTVVIFPLFGAVALFGPMLLQSRKVQILRHGQVSTARVTAVEKTSVQINDRCQYKIHLSRTSDGLQMVRRTCSSQEISFAARKWKDAESVKILYLLGRQNSVLLPESWNE